MLLEVGQVVGCGQKEWLWVAGCEHKERLWVVCENKLFIKALYLFHLPPTHNSSIRSELTTYPPLTVFLHPQSCNRLLRR